MSSNHSTNISSPEFLNELWDAIRDVAATSGRRATRIVLFDKKDLENALGLISQNNSQASTLGGRGTNLNLEGQ